ncbi:MAG: PEGA domain-containing protein [Opitutales bacterium]|nr:PEGA domain-containing protein [Opitutales bacterium]
MKHCRNAILKCFPPLAFCGMLSGCAAMISGPAQEVEISSFPLGASVYANGKFVGNTPTTVEMNRDSHPLVVLKKDGYADTRLEIETEWNETTLLNLGLVPFFALGFPLTGWIIDARSGATNEYTEDNVVVPLLSENLIQLRCYKGNVKLSNLNPTDEGRAQLEGMRNALIEEASNHIVPVFRYVYDSVTNIRRGVRVVGTAWIRVDIDANGRIVSYVLERAEGVGVGQEALTVLGEVSKSFEAPEELLPICPLSITVPVEYKNQ